MPKKKKVIQFTLKELGVSEMQYKPLNPTFYPMQPIIVDFSVSLDTDDFYYDDLDILHLTPAGFMVVMDVIERTIGLGTYRLDIQMEAEKAKIMEEEVK